MNRLAAGQWYSLRFPGNAPAAPPKASCVPGRATDLPTERIHNHMKLAQLAALSLIAFGLAQSSLAQQAGFRDLSASWRAPDDHLASPSSPPCPSVNATFSHGENAGPPPSADAKKPAALRLTIVHLVPSQLRLSDDFTATLRLENVGTSPVLIPWQSDGEKVTRVSPDGTEEKYEVADVSFSLAAGKKPVAMPLETEGALFAHPDDPASYTQLAPGQWLEIKLKGNVACGLDRCPIAVEADDHAVLTAWWYQRVLTHRVKDCSEDHGSYKVREVDSAPFPVVLHAAPTPSGQHAGPKEQTLASGTLPADDRCSPRELAECWRVPGR